MDESARRVHRVGIEEGLHCPAKRTRCGRPGAASAPQDGRPRAPLLRETKPQG